MGARGPLKLVGASPAPNLDKTAAGAVQPCRPNKPAGVTKDKELSTLWDEIVPQLDAAGLISTADVMTIEMALRHFQLARKASSEVMDEGLQVRAYDAQDDEDGNPTSTRRHPSEIIFRQESIMFMEYAKQLGMTWMSRARTTAPKGEGEGVNPFVPGAATGS